MATANQIAYWKNQEDKRSHLAVEAETGRSNRVKEAQAWADLDEKKRHNLVGEQETAQHNRHTEGMAEIEEEGKNTRHLQSMRAEDARYYAGLDETTRHNFAQESETTRHNFAQESEANRHNVATEQEANLTNRNAEVLKQFDQDLSWLMHTSSMDQKTRDNLLNFWGSIFNAGSRVLGKS